MPCGSHIFIFHWAFQLCSWFCWNKTLLGPLVEGVGAPVFPSPLPFSSAFPRPCLIRKMNYAHTSQTSPSTWATQGNSSIQVCGLPLFSLAPFRMEVQGLLQATSWEHYYRPPDRLAGHTWSHLTPLVPQSQWTTRVVTATGRCTLLPDYPQP